MIQVGGYAATKLDFEIPAAHGLRQTIGDTLGIGGIFRALRTIPVMLGIGRRDGRAPPGRVVSQLHQPDGDAVLGDVRRQPAAAGRGPVPLRPEHHARAGRAGRRAVRGGVVPAAPASTTRPSSCGSSETARTSIRCSTGGSTPTPSCAGACGSRCTGGLATSRPSRASTPPSTCRGSCEATRRSSGSGSRSASTSSAARRTSSSTRRCASSKPASQIEIERSQEYASLIIHSIADRAGAGHLRQRAQRRPDPEPARRGVRRGAVPGRQKRRPADRGRRAAAAAGGAQPHVPERVRADGARGARGQPRARSPCRAARSGGRRGAVSRGDPRRSSRS